MTPNHTTPRTIQPGDIHWLQPENPDDVEPRIPHPHVIIQVNAHAADTVIVCALTSNLRRVSLPGNVLLEAGEANLPRQSVVEVAKITTVETSRLGAYIGTLSEQRVAQILAGIRFIERSFLPENENPPANEEDA